MKRMTEDARLNSVKLSETILCFAKILEIALADRSRADNRAAVWNFRICNIFVTTKETEADGHESEIIVRYNQFLQVGRGGRVRFSIFLSERTKSEPYLVSERVHEPEEVGFAEADRHMVLQDGGFVDAGVVDVGVGVFTDGCHRDHAVRVGHHTVARHDVRPV